RHPSGPPRNPMRDLHVGLRGARRDPDLADDPAKERAVRQVMLGAYEVFPDFDDGSPGRSTNSLRLPLQEVGNRARHLIVVEPSPRILASLPAWSNLCVLGKHATRPLC